MSTFAICSLAYGERCIGEFNQLVESLDKINPNLNIFVCTNDRSKIQKQSINIIETLEPFNYNLKMVAIESALQSFSKIICVDSDGIFSPTTNFTFIDNLSDNTFYCYHKTKLIKYLGYRLSMNKLLNGTTEFDNLNEYGIALKVLNNNLNDLEFIDEGIFLIRIEDINKRNEFISNWKNTIEYTKKGQRSDKNNIWLPGVFEGVILNLICKKLKININVYPTILIDFFNSFMHYGDIGVNISNKTII
jgi:hypothetical protein